MESAQDSENQIFWKVKLVAYPDEGSHLLRALATKRDARQVHHSVSSEPWLASRLVGPENDKRKVPQTYRKGPFWKGWLTG